MEGKWTSIYRSYKFPKKFNTMKLKDKWRNLVKYNYVKYCIILLKLLLYLCNNKKKIDLWSTTVLDVRSILSVQLDLKFCLEY